MRIDCEICGAAYGIDDALISEKGVRARCPQCGTQQVVHPHHEGATQELTAPPLPMPSESIPDWGEPSSPGQSSPFSFSDHSRRQQVEDVRDSIPRHPTFPPGTPLGEPSNTSQNPFAEHSGLTSARAIARSSSIVALDASTNPRIEQGPVTAEGAPAYIPSALQTSPESAPLSMPSFGVSFGAAPAPADASAPQPADGSWNAYRSSPGTTDPAYQAPVLAADDAAYQAPVLAADDAAADSQTPPPEHTAPGETDRHSPLSLESGTVPVELDKPQDAANVLVDGENAKELWQVQTNQTRKTGVPLSQLRNMIRRGAIGKNDEVGRMGEELQPLAHFPDFLILLPSPTAESLTYERRAQGTAAASGIPRPALWLGVAAVVGTIGYGVATGWPDLLGGTDAPTSGGAAPTSEGPGVFPLTASIQARAGLKENPVDKIRQIWSVQYPKIEGNAASHVDAAEKASRADTQTAYEKADGHYKQALLLEPDNFAAVTGFIENFAQMVDCRVNAEALDFTRSLLGWAKEHFGDRAEIYTAQGALQYATEDLQGARLAVAKSMALGDESPRAKLLRARVMMDVNPSESFEISRSLFLAGGDFRAAEFLMGAAHRRLGAYVKSKQTLQNILQVSPNHRNTLKELAELDLDAGDAKAAVRRLDQLLTNDDRDIDAHLLRAKIIHQTLQDRDLAEKRLRFVIDHLEREAGPLIRNALVHYAHVLLERKEFGAAQAQIERALQLDERYPPSHFAAARLYRNQGEYPKAESHLQKAVISASSAEGEEALAELSTRLGEVQAAMERWPEAEKTLSPVLAEHPVSPRPYLALASMYMKQGETAKANVAMRKVLNLDPKYSHQRLALTDYPDSDDVYRDYAASFLNAKVQPGEKSLQHSGAGIALYHAGDIAKSRKNLNRALRLDSKNLGALLYLSTLDLDNGNKTFARKRLERALRSVGGQHNITKLYMARTELEARQDKQASARLNALLEEDATSVTSRYSLGEAYVRSGQKEQGVEQLREVLRADPNFQPAKKLLFELKE